MPSLGTVASSRRPPPSPPVNMFSDQLSLMLGADAVAPGALLGMWRVHTGNGRLARTSDSTGGRAGKVMKMTVAVSTVANFTPSTGQAANRNWAVPAGTTLTFFMSIRATRAMTCTAAAVFTRADGSAIATGGTITTPWAVTTGWQDFRFVFTAPPEAVLMSSIAVNCPTLAPGTDEVWFAQAGLFPGDVPAWVPVTANTWTRNLLDAERASMETNALAGGSGGTTVVSGWRATLGGMPPAERVTAPAARSGTWALRLNSGTGTSPRADTNVPSASRYALPAVPLAPNTFMLSVYPTSPIAANTVVIQAVYFSDAALTTTAGSVNYITDEAIAANAWYDVVLPLRNTNLAAVWVMLTVQPAGQPNNADLLFDRVGWFDGHVGSWTHPSTPGPP